MNNRPFHVSMFCRDLEESRHFYRDVLGFEEKRSTSSSIHINFYGSQLTLHYVPGFNAENVHREVDAEDVPVPHIGAILTAEEFHVVVMRLKAASIKIFLEPHIRFKKNPHEQWVLFFFDPSNNAIELKCFTKVKINEWA